MVNANSNVDSDTARSIIQCMTGAVYIQDENLVFQGANLLCATLCGYSASDDMIGTTYYDMRCKAVETAPEFSMLDKQIMNQNDDGTMIVIDTFIDETLSVYFVKKSPMLGGDNKVNGILTQGFFLDSKQNIADIGLHLASLDGKRHGLRTDAATYSLSNKNNEFSLTDKECEVLFYLIRGKSMRETAVYLSRSPRTIEAHLEGIKSKMNCQTKSQVIEKALIHGYLAQLPDKFLSGKIILPL